MYRNYLFLLIIKNIYRYFLLLTIIQISNSKILFCSYQNDYLKFNNQIIRETVSSKNINSYYAVTLQNSDIYITTDENTECSIINGFQTNNFNDHFTNWKILLEEKNQMMKLLVIAMILLIKKRKNLLNLN